MEKTRANTSGPQCLSRWNAHRAELTDAALKEISDPDILTAFRNWVVKGDNSPQYGDLLYDFLLCKKRKFKMNNMFMYKLVVYGLHTPDPVYHDCILRTRLGTLPPGTMVEKISIDTTTVELVIDGARVQLVAV